MTQQQVEIARLQAHAKNSLARVEHLKVRCVGFTKLLKSIPEDTSMSPLWGEMDVEGVRIIIRSYLEEAAFEIEQLSLAAQQIEDAVKQAQNLIQPASIIK